MLNKGLLWKLAEAGLVLVLLLALWFEHNSRIRQEVLFQQQEKATEKHLQDNQKVLEGISTQINANNTLVQQEIAARSKEQDSLKTLTNALISLQEQERVREAQVATMTPQELNVALQEAFKTNFGAISTLPIEAQRNIEEKVVALDSCQAQLSVANQQVSKCEEITKADDNIISAQRDTIDSLNQALQVTKDSAAAKQAELESKLKVQRGSWIHRTLIHARDIGIGVVVGMAIGL